MPSCLSAVEGSSPLARGPLGGKVKNVGGKRIIPARAGSTVADGGYARIDQDHPRSRGVHVRLTFSIVAIAGSSPLARGPLAASAASSGSPRIIPARAGSTESGEDVAHITWDHPRSRGVHPS